MKPRHRRSFRILTLLVLFTLLAPAFLTSAQVVNAQSDTPAIPVGPSDPAEVKSFVDGLVNGYLEKYHISGATIAVVGGSELLYTQGYGSANIAENTPVDPYRHLFRIGSTSKLFVWTAVMQLVEQGKLDLDTNVNTYLKEFQIENPFAEPVTLRRLMSHTAGFEESNAGLNASSLEKILPLNQFLPQYQPVIVREPGQMVAYSNYGAALAAHIVEIVSGMPFGQYIEENIYKPLGMQRSTFSQPLPAELADDLARGYTYHDGFVEQSFDAINLGPAGAMNATAPDMAKFMLALMQADCQTNPCLLKPETFRQMRQRIFPQDLRLDGMAYGFMDRRINGIQFLDHGGGLPPYYGMLVIQPESRAGFYVNFIGDSGALAAVGDFKSAFIDHYYPYEPEIPAGKAITPVKQLVGTYRWTRSNYTSPERFAEISGVGAQVTENEVGDLNITTTAQAGSATNTYLEIEPLVFRSADGRSTAIFQPDPDGIGMVFFLTGAAERAYEQIPWFELPMLNLALLAGGGIILASFVLIRLTGLFIRRKKSSPGAKRARAFLLLACLAAVLDVAAGFAFGMALLSGAAAFKWTIPVLSWLFILLTLTSIVSAVQAWRCAYWNLAGRVHYTLSMVACIGVIWPLIHWNFLKFIL